MTSVGAGWHPDPRGRHEHRYWDGTRWTDYVADGGRMSIDPVDDAPRFVEVGSAPERPDAAAVPERRPDPAPAARAQEAERPERRAGGVLWAGEAAGEPEPEPIDARPEAQAPAAPSARPGRSPGLTALLSLLLPGSGHLYAGVAAERRPTAYLLLASTVLAILLAYLGLGTFLVGLALWLASAAYALRDLHGERAGLRDTRLGARLAGWVLTVAGLALAVSLLLPWYRVMLIVPRDVELRASGFDALERLDVVLFALAATSTVVGLVALGRSPAATGDLPPVAARIVAIAGAVAVVLVYFRMLVDPIEHFGVDLDVGRAPGILLAGAAAIAIGVAGVGAWRAGYRGSP